MDFIYFFIGLFILFVFDLFLNFYKDKLAKKCNYNCEKCTVCYCPAHECHKKRSKYEK